ncbi:MAG: 4Fe-4S binding protein [Clostridiales bacterium]|jgi:Fe-S-cluster-containing dehydrogenase component|nr:4Fe-4S binding protein [Clostridiales bacterium]
MARVLKSPGMNKCIGCFTCMLNCAAVNHKNHSISKSAIKVKTSGGLQGKFVSVFCLACRGERACMQACPSGALVKRPGGGVVLKEDACTGCGKCVEACIVGAVHFDEDQHLPIICKHCGICARVCPHGCLKMEEVPDDL